ncbi:hypothetical protein [Cerasicoccus frondis]|uniref:hypothetical protein n=1 Tax=Cerasicoccus frondis TaxID=490090 RepID=UPI002852DACD|nr:hypothetical protein [Cerasicoccus frondis]
MITSPLQSRVVAAAPAIHTYFDVVPESPDGKRLVYFRFDGKPLTWGTVVIQERATGREVEVTHCPGIPHSGAKQGWLDNDHIYFSSDSQIYIATAEGQITQKFAGSINTFCPTTRRGLASSSNWHGAGRPPKECAIYRIDIEDESLHELLDRDQAWEVVAAQMDLTGVRRDLLHFKNSKWAPGGKRWFTVFTNEKDLPEHPDQPRVKVLIAADDQGGNVKLIGEFGHHPKWMPDGSAIYAFSGGNGAIAIWDADTGESRLLCRMPDEGHPSVHPDGKSILSDGYENGEVAVYWQDLRTGETQELSRAPHPEVDWQKQHPPYQVCHAHPVWSHDGQRIYFNATVGEFPELRMIEVG